MMRNDNVVWSTAWRKEIIEQLSNAHANRQVWDLVVVGGGITGAGIYREAVNRGLKVLLVEQRDFAWGTSSRSSKMVHGGLRYLGSGQLGLANASVKERQKLLNELPGLVDILPFVMGHYKGKFPGPWLFDKVLTIYDWMAGKRYRRFYSKGIKDFMVPGINTENLLGMTQFADAIVDDARLVLRVLHEGNSEGGTALNYVKAIDTLRNDDKVIGLKLQDQIDNETFDVITSVVINATGVWTDKLRSTLGHHRVIRPLRGSHLVLPFWRLPISYTVGFFHPKDNRPVFVYPWEGCTIIGTTDLDHKADAATEASISESELAYLLEAANHQFPQANLRAVDIRSTWSGVRPVVSKNQNAKVDLAKPSDEKREHAIWDDNGLISVAGGKLTTFRLIAIDALNAAKPYMQRFKGDFKDSSPFKQETQKAETSNTPKNRRLKGRYGEFANDILGIDKSAFSVTGNISSTQYLWAELIWSCQNESVMHLDDLLLRRVRIGLLLEDGGAEVMQHIQSICCYYLKWDNVKWQLEHDRYKKIIRLHYSLPLPPSSPDKER